MKSMYWHARKLPRYFIILTCIASIIGLAIVEHYKRGVPQPYFEQKIAAAQLADMSMQAIRAARLQQGIKINPSADPALTGLIGERMTEITTDRGDIAAKRISINPNMAAVIVDWLKQAGVNKGDLVAIGMTGSFPALDICTLAAVRTLGAKPILITSAAASQWGANIPGFSWLNMLNILNKKGIISFTPVASSLGGVQDRAKNMSAQGRNLLLKTIKEYKIPFLRSTGTVDGINQRMALFDVYANGDPIKVYINVGGGIASIGLHEAAKKVIKKDSTKRYRLPDGYIQTLPINVANTDSVAVRFLKQGVPVINLREIRKIATEFGFPLEPTTMPIVGQGLVYYRDEYNTYLATAVLFCLILILAVVSYLSRKILIKYQLR